MTTSKEQLQDPNKEQNAYDIVVYGSTPCGISAALAAARYGRKVALIANGSHIGGMMASGLSITDLRFPHAFGGIFKELSGRVLAYYTEHYGKDSQQVKDSNDGIWFEPHVAEMIFEQMLAEQSAITIVRNMRLAGVNKEAGELKSIEVLDRATGASTIYHAGIFIDGSYEGDMAAAAGARYRVGREGREEHYEPYAGFIFLKNPGLQVLEGSTGEGDKLIQAYNYRLCLTNRDDIRVLPQKPESYNRDEYVPLIALYREGKLKGLNDVIRLAPIPNGKFNGNNRPIAVSLDLPVENTQYPEADEEGRQAIIKRYRSYMTGLLWFLQNDPDISQALREEVLTWGFCSDEFADNGHVPYEFYVREARRIYGKKTFTSLDAFLAPGSERTPVHEDSVAVGDYHVDSHIVQRPQPGWPQMEGHVYLRPISKPAQIPYGVIVPEEIGSLLVPGALSATHLGFSVLRMEPPWMALGQSAGTAAHLALLHGSQPADVSVKQLQKLLLEQGQVISFFHDTAEPDPIWWILNRPGERTKLDPNHEDGPAISRDNGIQYFATKGFFTTYYARPYDPVTRSEAVRWLSAFMELEGVDWQQARVDEAPRFSDIGASHPDFVWVQQLGAAGIIGTWQQSDGFYPGAALSRQDAFNWAVRANAYLESLKSGNNPSRTVGDHSIRHTGSSHSHDEVRFRNEFLHTGSDTVEWQQLIEHEHLPASWKQDLGAKALFYTTREEFCELLYNIHMHASVTGSQRQELTQC